jgi:hypothetical protein
MDIRPEPQIQQEFLDQQNHFERIDRSAHTVFEADDRLEFLWRELGNLVDPITVIVPKNMFERRRAAGIVGLSHGCA